MSPFAGSGPGPRPCPPATGFSAVETLITLAILSLIAAVATPSYVAARDDALARGAARHLVAQLHLARLEALKRHANVALRFEPIAAPAGYATYADGNGNGVRNADIDAGDDLRIRAFTGLGDQFPGVRFALDSGVPVVGGGDSDGTGGVQVGRSGMVSFSPEGTSTSGTVYVLGRGHRQFAVRVLGPTGRVRVFEFTRPAGLWQVP